LNGLPGFEGRSGQDGLPGEKGTAGFPGQRVYITQSKHVILTPNLTFYC
jgi:hypothetical protein